MPDDNRNLDEDRQRKNGEFKMPSRGWMAWILIICLAGLFFIFKSQYEPQGNLIDQHKFKELADSNLISKATVKFNPSSDSKDITGEYIDGQKKVPFHAK